MLLKFFRSKKLKLSLLSFGLFILLSIGSKVYGVEPFPLSNFQSNASNVEEVEFCREILRKALPLFEKDLTMLTEDERNFLDFAFFLYDATYICLGRIFPQILIDFKGFNKLPSDKLTILVMAREKDELLTKDTLPLLIKHYPTCSNYKTFKEQVKCIYDESRGLAHVKPVNPSPSIYFNYFAVALLSYKFPNKILLVQYEPYFEGITRITIDRFLDRLKKFRKKPTKPMCILFENNVLECPLFNLEKTFTPEVERINFIKSIFPIGIAQVHEKNVFSVTITLNPAKIPKETVCYQAFYTPNGEPEKVEFLYKVGAEIVVSKADGLKLAGGLGKPSEDLKKSLRPCNFSPFFFSLTKLFVNWIGKEFFNPNYPRLP
ncbi:MAG: hypothetical protein N2327_02460 [Caldimicrobium sp.]|nr:hypothetical protein [Caldimicrobium sp.]MCX7873283.1 hypothetical protein [Caldimicrobium sp.]MDW8093479.1 hypothetical protein [Caldimicrobium sp.]